MKLSLFFLSLFFVVQASSEDVFRIEIGKDYKHYSNADLQRRVWDLERAVWQMQRRVFELELKGGASKEPVSDSWVCTVSERGNKHMGTGGSKAVAKAKAMEACTKANDGNGFFCDEPKCEQ